MNFNTYIFLNYYLMFLESYSEARLKAVKGEETSNLSSADNDVKLIKRQKKIEKREVVKRNIWSPASCNSSSKNSN